MKLIDVGIFRRLKKSKRLIFTCVEKIKKRVRVFHVSGPKCLRFLSGIFLSFILVTCRGDTCLPDEDHQWQRPTDLPPITRETENFFTENTNCISETQDFFEPETPETENLTETEPFCEIQQNIPFLSIGRIMYSVEEEAYLYEILLSPIEEGQLQGLLFTLHIEDDGEIYAVTCGNMCGELNFSYIIYNRDAAVLFDGTKPVDVKKQGVLCYVAVRARGEKKSKMAIKIAEYVIK